MPLLVTDSAAAAAAFQFRTFELNEFNTLRCHVHSFPSLHAAQHAHASASALARPLLWETPVRRFLNLHLLASDVDRRAFDPAHPMFVTQEAGATCRIYAPSVIDNVRTHGATQRALAEACEAEALPRAQQLHWARLL